MATTLENIEALEEALATGTTEVTFADGRSVRYANAAALARAISYFRGKLRRESGSSPVNVSVGAFYRG